MAFLEQRLNVKLNQKQILTPSLVQMVSVLTLNKQEISELISQELMQNPVLEELTEETNDTGEEIHSKEDRITDPSDKEIIDATSLHNDELSDPFEQIDYGNFFDEYLDPGYRTQASSELTENRSFENSLTKPINLYDHLQWQLNLSVLPTRIVRAAASVIGNLNEDGYLTANLEEISVSGKHTVQEILEALKIVQSFDPSGVGARNLKECLLIQLEHLQGNQSTAKEIVEKHLKQLQKSQYPEISRSLRKPLKSVLADVSIIKGLDPRPGQRYNKQTTRVVEPDVFIVKAENDYSVILNEDDMPQLRLSRTYRKMIKQEDSSREVKNYIKDRYSSAMQFIKNIEQRKRTIIQVCESIVQRQVAFLDSGLDHLRPMMIKELADEIGVHSSTVSRAVANKYCHTPQGVYELRYFFSEAVRGPAGNLIPLIVGKRKLKELIDQEDPTKPLTDEQLTNILNEKGIMVTRRSVAKYREDLKIPSIHQRRIKNDHSLVPKLVQSKNKSII